MRMRKKKNGALRLQNCGQFLAVMPDFPLENSEYHFGRVAPIFLEIGAGKGGFALEMSKRHPEAVYYAMERVSDCVVLAVEEAKRTADERPDNIRFLIGNADNLTEYFAPNTIDALFLNFSDPWSKKGYRKRRLTYRKFLAMYFTLLKEGATLTFKTDNVGLFDFSLEEIEAMGLVPEVVTRDLHASEWNADNIMTEYERNFTEQGMKIHMLRVRRPVGYTPVYVEEKRVKACENSTPCQENGTEESEEA